MKKLKVIIVILIILCVGLVIGCVVLNKDDSKKTNIESNSNKLKELPKPEVTGGQRGELGIDKNINESNIDEYLGREDAVYRDMRMLEDPAKYESIGGDRFLSGYIKGFEVTPLPYIIPVEGLPSEVGETYKGDTLFRLEDGKYVPNYEESMSIIEKIFPKDKVIFLMCGGGGYAGMTKNFLVSLGWNSDKIYNVGGYWYYEGKNNVEVKKIVDDKVIYDFDKVPYNKIEFDKLTKIANSNNNSNVAVTGIKISTSKISMKKNTNFTLSATVIPEDATNKKIRWTSSNTSVATVDSNGIVSAKGAGTAKIKAITEDGNKSVSCTVTVTEDKKNESNNSPKVDNRVKLSSEFYNYNAKHENSLIKEFDSIDVRDGLWPGHDYCSEDKKSEDNENCFQDRTDAQYEKDQKTTIQMKANFINKLLKDKKSFVVVVNAGDICTAYGDEPNSFERYVDAYLSTKKIYSLTMGLLPLKSSELYKKVKYNPAVIIVKDGKIYKYIDANMDEYTKLSKDKNASIKWIEENIVIK